MAKKPVPVAVAGAVAEDSAGLREALRRPVIRRTVTQRYDEKTGEWVPETKTSEVGIGPVGATLVAVAALGVAGAIVSGASEAARRREALKAAGNEAPPPEPAPPSNPAAADFAGNLANLLRPGR